MMKSVVAIALLGLVGVTVASGFTCKDGLACGETPLDMYDRTKCTAEWGAFPRVNLDTNQLIAQQFKLSFEYLLIGSHFKNWKVNRPGFAGYFNKLSDENWNEAISLMTHMVERGGNLVEGFSIDAPTSITTRQSANPDTKTEETTQLKEMDALSKALDNERKTATKTLHLAHLANHGTGVPHDSEFADFLAERLHHNSVLRIKHLANYVNLLADIVQDATVDHGYALFKFDSYLK